MTGIQLHYKKEGIINVEYLAKVFPNAPENRIQLPTNESITYNPFHIRNIQNYNPIYGLFFELTESNYNKITLNQPYGIRESSLVNIETGETIEKPIFFKFAPLLDPIRYMVGKYDLDDPTLKQLPSILKTESCFPKIADSNNVSYVDAFFCYLGSQLLHHNNMFHSADFYGSYVGVQELFKTNITDEIDYLHSSDFFGKHLNVDFYVENPAFSEYMNYGSRTNRQRICISAGNSRASRISLGAEEINEDSMLCDTDKSIPTEEIIYEKTTTRSEGGSSKSSSSSQNSAELNYSSDEEEEEEEEETPEDNGEEECNDEYETDTNGSGTETQEEELYAFIKDFPTQMICLEKCDGTLDELFLTDKIDVKTASSCLFQIIMTLIIYQKAFHFTHNDLHTNNIMYMDTDIEYIYYCYESTYYRVPTYGRIFKIIDFGRSIYTFQGKTFCSDSFSHCGDAYTQYNCEPYINNKKPRIDPNPSFDLCRLGCSIFDFIMEDDTFTPENELQETIVRWCTDDNGRNVMYKRSGEERYPGFKLYKMIARNVHKHTPSEQLKFPYFSQFRVSTKKMSKYSVETIRKNGINIDEIPSYVLA